MLQVDAPVSGGVKGATAGTLAFMVGGEDEAFGAAQPVLEPMAGKTIHCGAAGAGQAAKVCNNMILAAQQIVVGEAFVLAERLGLEHQSLYDVVTGATGNCWALHTNCPVPGPVEASPANNDFRAGFSTGLMNKDLGLALAALESTGTVAPLGAAAAAIYDEFARENADKDFSAAIPGIRDSTRSCPDPLPGEARPCPPAVRVTPTRCAPRCGRPGPIPGSPSSSPGTPTARPPA